MTITSQIIGIAADFAEIEKLRSLGRVLHRQIAENDEQLQVLNEDKAHLEAAYDANNLQIIAATERVHSFLAGYRAAPVEEKKPRAKKVTSESPPAAEKHPCTTCGDVFYSKVDLAKHLRAEHKISLEEAVVPVPEGQKEENDFLSLCADCLGECGEYPPTNTKVGCNRYSSKPNADQTTWRESVCLEWRGCPFTAKCFGPSNEENPTCFKEDEIRRRGEASLVADMAAFHIDSASNRNNVPCWNSSCAWADLAQADHCDADEQFRAGRPVHECGCLVTGDAPAKGQDGAGCINFECDDNRCQLGCNALEEPWTCEKYHSAGWGPTKEETAEVFIGNDDVAPTDAEILSQHEPADKILPRGEFRTEDIPKGKKKRADLLEARRKDVADLVARRIDYFTRGSAVVSAYDKSMGYDLHFGLKQNATQLSYALTQFNGLNELLNPSTPGPSKEDAKQEPAQPADESPAQASEVVRCRNNSCDYFDSFLPDNCSRLALGEPEPVTACKNYRAEFGLKEAAPQQHVPDDCDNCGNRGIIDGTDDYCNCFHGVRARKGDQAELERRKLRKEALNATATPEPETESEEAATEGAGDSADSGDGQVSRTYAPLDELLGDCELCHGSGVVDGELFGDFALIPCICEAGAKVAGEKWAPVKNLTRKACCNDCTIDDPDCHSCELLDQADPAELPKCANGSCTATGKDAKDACLRVQGASCPSFVDVKDCKHHMLKRSDVNGATVCDLCGFVLRTAEREAERIAALEKEAALTAPTALQLKCPHPKPFRIQTVEGEMCKVCKLVLGGQSGQSL